MNPALPKRRDITKRKSGVKSCRVINLTKNTVVAQNAGIADNLFSRMRGLLGRKSLNLQEGLILRPCNSIHTFFMQFPIDVVFLDRYDLAIKVYHSLPPWRMSGTFFRSALCLELPAGSLLQSRTQEGDRLQIF